MRILKVALEGIALGSLLTAMALGQEAARSGEPGTVRRTAYQYDDYLFYAPQDKPGTAVAAPAPTVPTPQTPSAAPPAPTQPEAKKPEEEKKEEGKEEEKEEDKGPQPWKIPQPQFLKEHGINLSGWLDQGYTVNNHGTDYNGVQSFNDRQGYQLNQFWWFIERTTDTSKKDCDWGVRADVVYGSDVRFVKAAKGMEADWNETDYNQLWVPAFYVDYAYKDWLLRAGRIYTPIGYEVIPANGNFFYSQTYCHIFLEPTTHLGSTVMKKFGEDEKWAIMGGIIEGCDIIFSDTPPGTIASLGYTQKDNKYSALFAICNTRGPVDNQDQTRYGLSLMWQATEKVKLVMEHDMTQFTLRPTAAAGTPAGVGYSFVQYAFYEINKQWSAGLRGEYCRDNNGIFVTSPYAPSPLFGGSFAGDFYDITAGLNWKPDLNLTVRPEIRYDWYRGAPSATSVGPLPFGNGTFVDQITSAVDVILTF